MCALDIPVRTQPVTEEIKRKSEPSWVFVTPMNGYSDLTQLLSFIKP